MLAAHSAALRKLDPSNDDLLDLLKQHFVLTPNHNRPLDGRVVGERFDLKTNQMRPVTDHEIAAEVIEHRTSRGIYGDRIRQTWTFRAADGTAFCYNATWKPCRYFGLQQASTCQSCGQTRWNRIDRAPSKLCAECRAEAVTRRSGLCDEVGGGVLACSTCYLKHGCRCTECRAWKAGYDRRRREARNSVSPTRELQEKPSLSPVRTPVVLTEFRHRTSAAEVATWTWLPADVRAVVGEYAAGLNQEGQDARAKQGRAVGRRDRTRQAEGPSTVWRAEKRARPMPSGKRNLQTGLHVLLARGAGASDGTIWIDAPGVGPVRMVAA